MGKHDPAWSAFAMEVGRADCPSTNFLDSEFTMRGRGRLGSKSHLHTLAMASLQTASECSLKDFMQRGGITRDTTIKESSV